MNNTMLFPYFQPIINLVNGQIAGYEALARRYNENQQVISAGEIFSSKDINVQTLIELDRQVRWCALQKFSELKAPSGYLTINISAAWLQYITDRDPLPTLEMLNQLDIDRSRIIIEITEHEADIDTLIRITKKYREAGLQIAIDDLGTGSSDLERMVALNPDLIKIDLKLFKAAAASEGISREIVRLLIHFGKRHGCKIICEGVETEAEFIFALSLDVQFIQGFLFSPATENFQQKEQYTAYINQLKEGFLIENIKKEKAKIQRLKKVEILAHELKTQLQKNALDTLQINASGLNEIGLLRFFLCSHQGEQISPDFNLLQGEWHKDASKLGINWSCRPYFYRMLALKQGEQNTQLIISERYRDFDTGVLCKTISIFLDAQRILMLDIESKWD